MRFQAEIGNFMALHFYHCSGFGCLLLAACKVTYFTQKWTQEKYLTPPAGEQVVLQKGERRFAREKKRYSGIFSMLCANFSKHEFFAMQILVTA